MDPGNSIGSGPEFLLVINLFHRGPYGPPLRGNGHHGCHCISRAPGSILLFVGKYIETCNFSGGGSGPLVPPLDPPMRGTCIEENKDR